jgi:hypothetical protein
MEKIRVNKAQYIKLLQDALAVHPDFKPGMQIFAGPESGALKSSEIFAYHYLPLNGEMSFIIGQLVAEINSTYELDVFSE